MDHRLNPMRTRRAYFGRAPTITGEGAAVLGAAVRRTSLAVPPIALASFLLISAALITSVRPDPAAAQAEGGGPDSTTSSTAPEVPTAAITGPEVDPVEMSAAAIADGRDATGRVVGPSFALSGVPATSALLDDASGRLQRSLASRGEMLQRRDRARLDALDAAFLRTSSGATADRLEQRAAKVRVQLDRTRSDTVRLAVARYVAGTTGYDALDPAASVEKRLSTMTDTRIGDSASADLSSSITTLERALRDTNAEARTLHDTAASAAAVASDRSSDALIAARAVTQLDAVVRQARRDVAEARPTSMVAGSDIPMVALDAYWRASRRLAEQEPQCRLGWSLLAGIGRSESGHGTHGGSTVRPDGSETAPIIGIALDGTNNTRAIPDSDRGELDGDPIVDRAVGPMQFLPGTWRRWGADLSGDGVIDPQNIYDAALAAGRYLCSAGGDLSTADGQRRGVLAYNRSDSYADLVLSRAESYRSLAVPETVA